jgi:predicted TPR repeat methyltransferase
LLSFSVETHDGEGVIIGAGLRYAHGADYVREQIEAAGLKLMQLEEASSRTENDAPVRGLVAVAAKT